MDNSYAGITAVILAGGLGTRLRSEVPDRSKVVATVGDRPFITRLLDQLMDTGVRKAVLCTGYKGEGVQALLGDRHRDLQLVYSLEREPLGTAGALRHALPKMDTDTLLVMNGDSYFSGNLLKLLRFHRENAASGSIMLCYSENASAYGHVNISETHLIEAFEEKRGVEESGWVNTGCYLLSKRWIESIPPGRKVSLEAEIFPAWIARNLYGFRAEGQLLDIGTPERYRQAERFFAALGG